jgi:hypothetical protein
LWRCHHCFSLPHLFSADTSLPDECHVCNLVVYRLFRTCTESACEEITFVCPSATLKYRNTTGILMILDMGVTSIAASPGSLHFRYLPAVGYNNVVDRRTWLRWERQHRQY